MPDQMTASVLSEEELKQQIRVRLALGRLPVANGGYATHRGTGRPCIVCRRAIESPGIECEVEAPGIALHAHVLCHHLWREASLDATSEPRRGSL